MRGFVPACGPPKRLAIRDLFQQSQAPAHHFDTALGIERSLELEDQLELFRRQINTGLGIGFQTCVIPDPFEESRRAPGKRVLKSASIMVEVL